MERNIRARTEALINSCLNNSSEDEISSDSKEYPNNSLQKSTALQDTHELQNQQLDSIHGERYSETLSVNNAFPLTKTDQLNSLHEISNLPYHLPSTPPTISAHDKSGTDSSCLKTSSLKGFSKALHCRNLQKTSSLLSSQPLLELNKLYNDVFGEIDHGDDYKIASHETNAEKSIEPPPYSPLTPRPQNVQDSIISPLDLPSPLPTMSPETKKIYTMLANSSIDDESGKDQNLPGNIHENDCIIEETSRCSDETNVYDSDDSVKDPDYSCADQNDNSSERSVSLLTTTVEVHSEPHSNTRRSNYCNPVSSTSVCTLPNDNEDLIVTESETPELAVTNNSVPFEIANENNNVAGGRPKKGRKRKYGNMSREQRKKRKYLNLAYVNSKNEVVEPKQFLDYRCSCKNKCYDLIPVGVRSAEYNKFYALGSYNSQTMFIVACVKEEPVKRAYVSKNTGPVSKKKTFSRQYLINSKPVCKDMFLNTYRISSKRINTALLKMRSENCLVDKRGLNGGRNKASPERETVLTNVIKKLPTYVSHYRHAGCNDAKFLRSDMTFSKIYELYCEETIQKKVKPLSFAKAKNVFLTKFNLRTKTLKKDTCNKCDFYLSQKSTANEENMAIIEKNHESHIEKAKSLQNQLKKDMKLAKEDPTTETLTFDLQKTLPLPRIPTNLVFYSRHLWVYNLGIHSGSDDQAHCNVWVEGEAGRGSQEVGSCLLKHVLERVDRNVQHLILWCDSCGGQNRNIKVTLMLKALLNDHPTLQTIRIRFLESGHSFLPNDTDFGKIECALKLQQRIYTPEDYMKIMKSCKKQKPMHVHRMNTEDFLSSESLENCITNRKKTVDGSKVSWLTTKEILLKKSYMYSIFMRTDLNGEFAEVNIQKRGRRPHNNLITKSMMAPLWPNGKPVPEAKVKDLKALLHLIPKDAQLFYKSITGDSTIDDDIDGFSGLPDFEIERSDDD